MFMFDKSFFESDEKELEKKLKEINKRLEDALARIRILEERMELIMKKIDDVEAAGILFRRDVDANIKRIEKEVSKLKEELIRIREDMRSVKERVKDVATKDELKVLEKYIELLNPLECVRRDEVEEIVRDVLEELGVKGERE